MEMHAFRKMTPVNNGDPPIFVISKANPNPRTQATALDGTLTQPTALDGTLIQPTANISARGDRWMDLIDCIGVFLVSATPLKPLNGVDETCTREQQHRLIFLKFEGTQYL